jgi:DNA-binding MarR family transcriptional regulator
MKRISNIGGLLKRLYRMYNSQLLQVLESRGFTDLRPSFLEVLLVICENEGPSIKEIGAGCGLKKQTMTSHLNELEKRGYIFRQVNASDKREQKIYLTEYGEKFKLNLFECLANIENEYCILVGDVELDRIEYVLENYHTKLTTNQIQRKASEAFQNLTLDF